MLKRAHWTAKLIFVALSLLDPGVGVAIVALGAHPAVANLATHTAGSARGVTGEACLRDSLIPSVAQIAKRLTGLLACDHIFLEEVFGAGAFCARLTKLLLTTHSRLDHLGCKRCTGSQRLVALKTEQDKQRLPTVVVKLETLAEHKSGRGVGLNGGDL